MDVPVLNRVPAGGSDGKCWCDGASVKFLWNCAGGVEI